MSKESEQKDMVLDIQNKFYSSSSSSSSSSKSVRDTNKPRQAQKCIACAQNTCTHDEEKKEEGRNTCECHRLSRYRGLYHIQLSHLPHLSDMGNIESMILNVHAGGTAAVEIFYRDNDYDRLPTIQCVWKEVMLYEENAYGRKVCVKYLAIDGISFDFTRGGSLEKRLYHLRADFRLDSATCRHLTGKVQFIYRGEYSGDMEFTSFTPPIDHDEVYSATGVRAKFP